LGFRVGADSQLADWGQISGYFARLAAASPRVRVDTLGATTQGRPYLLVTITDSANLARRAELMAGQRRLADPRTLEPEAEAALVRSQPVVILVSCSIHSTEIAASQMSMELAWRLVTDSAEAALLRDVVVLLVPSANPDGIDIVTDWYRRTRGTPYDGSPPPWMYHPYIGHDDNRDWYMLTQPETRYLTRVLYHDWFPEVVYDVHQMGNTGARMFVPPFADPVNPNLDGMLVEAINQVGTTMAGALADSGYTGVAHQISFDLWWHGGNRTVPARHNMIGILTEAASARLASPVRLTSLRQPERGVNYPSPWPGGWWRLRDIVDYELVTSEALVRLAAHEHPAFVSRFVKLGRRAVDAGRAGQPAAYVIPADQRDEGARAQLANVLIADGVEVWRSRSPFAAGGKTYLAGSLVIPLAQPYRAHVKDLFERQAYPARYAYPGGPSLPPYDVTGWTLPLQMGVAVDSIGSAVQADLERMDTVAVAPGAITGSGDVVLLENRSNAEATAVWRALAGGATVAIAPAPFGAGGRTWRAGTLAVRGRGARATLESAARTLGFDGVAVSRLATWPGAPTIARAPRVAVYKSWNGNLDEGWTRWVLERLAIPYTTVTDSVVRAGELGARFDVVLVPSEPAAAIRNGRAAGSAPPEFTGGLGDAGAASLRAFLDSGGTVLALGEAAGYAIADLRVPGTVVTGGRPRRGEVGGRSTQPSDLSRFSAPGSIFEIELAREHPIASGMDSATAVYFIDTPILDAGPGSRIVAAYPKDRNPLLSGWVEGVERLEGHPALLETPVGRGRAILFAFRPQHRGQTNATYKLLTNAILYGAASAPVRQR
jgi:hypothetical protein